MQSTRPARNGVDANRIADVGEKLRTLGTELRFMFPEREHLIQQIIYALITREHVLVSGTFGTAKSDLLLTLFKIFPDAKMFPIELSRFMTEANIIGIPDPKKMREEGIVHYQRDGGILDADFVELDEFLDASEPLLRVLLGILNERQFKRGRQVEDARLHTAVACTNVDPDEALSKQPGLGAVLDRFLFHCKVGYLHAEENRRRMYQKFLNGEAPSVEIKLDDLKYLSWVAVDTNLFSNPYFIEVYDQIVEAFKNQVPGAIISDRRRCKLLQLVAANALLWGRYEIDIEDLMSIRWGLCMGGDTAQYDIFDKVAEPLIKAAKQNVPQNVDELQKKLLAELSLKIPDVSHQCSNDVLVNISRELVRLSKEVEEIKPTIASTEDEKKKVLSAIQKRLEDTTQIILTGGANVQP